jgi:hypothetical protein
VAQRALLLPPPPVVAAAVLLRRGPAQGPGWGGAFRVALRQQLHPLNSSPRAGGRHATGGRQPGQHSTS